MRKAGAGAGARLAGRGVFGREHAELSLPQPDNNGLHLFSPAFTWEKDTATGANSYWAGLFLPYAGNRNLFFNILFKLSMHIH